MTTHKYRVGQRVDVLPAAPAGGKPAGDYIVTDQFRHRGELYYCVKCPGEPYERSLAESRLRAADVGEPRKRSLPFAVNAPSLR